MLADNNCPLNKILGMCYRTLQGIILEKICDNSCTVVYIYIKRICTYMDTNMSIIQDLSTILCIYTRMSRNDIDVLHRQP